MSIVLHRLEMPVRWRDMDAFNHVNNASYLGYIEEARVTWLKSLSTDWDGEQAAPILAAISVNYRRPLAWPESIVVELSAERVGSKSLTVNHRILSSGLPEMLYADGHSVLVWVNRQGQTVMLPDKVRTTATGPDRIDDQD